MTCVVLVIFCRKMVAHLEEIVTKYEERVRSMQNVPSLVTDFLLFLSFSTYHDFLPSTVNIFRLDIGASFFNTTYHESTYHDFLPCSVNVFRLQIGAFIFNTTYYESVPSHSSFIDTHNLHFPLTTVPSCP